MAPESHVQTGTFKTSRTSVACRHGPSSCSSHVRCRQRAADARLRSSTTSVVRGVFSAALSTQTSTRKPCKQRWPRTERGRCLCLRKDAPFSRIRPRKPAPRQVRWPRRGAVRPPLPAEVGDPGLQGRLGEAGGGDACLCAAPSPGVRAHTARLCPRLLRGLPCFH